MEPVSLVFSLLALAGAGGSAWWLQRIKADAALMAATQTTPARDVARLAPGTQVEVKGTLRCAAPVTGEYSNKPCVHYVARIEREYERVERDSKGRRTTRRTSETISSNSLCCGFEVEDQSGRVQVKPEAAKVEAIQAVNRFETEAPSLSGVAVSLLGGDTTLGYRYVEEHVPLDIPVYVLGVVQADGSIGAPGKDAKGKSFLISHKSEEQRQADLASNRKWALALIGICIAVAIGLVIYSFFWGAASGAG